MTRLLMLLSILAAITGCSGDPESPPVVGELASDRIELTAEFQEPVVMIEFVEGDSVTAGAPLLRLDSARAEARLAEARAAQRQAQARLDELLRGPREETIAAARANLEGAVQELEFRRSEQRRIAELHARGLASADSLDRAGAALDAAQASEKLRRAQLSELLAGTTIEELQQAEQALEQATARHDAVSVDVARHTVTAPVDGIVDSRLIELGERPAIGQPLIIMLPGAQVHARVFVPETIRVQVSTGTAATIHVDGLDAPLAGRVRWISSDAAFTPYYALTEHDRGRLSYLAKIDIVDDIERLPDGVPVNVEFELQ